MKWQMVGIPPKEKKRLMLLVLSGRRASVLSSSCMWGVDLMVQCFLVPPLKSVYDYSFMGNGVSITSLQEQTQADAEIVL